MDEIVIPMEDLKSLRAVVFNGKLRRCKMELLRFCYDHGLVPISVPRFWCYEEYTIELSELRTTVALMSVPAGYFYGGVE